MFCQASVVLNGTRVIVEGAKKEKTLQFTNTGDQPALIQIQAINLNNHSVPLLWRCRKYSGLLLKPAKR
ncbi:fimbria/pilus periplasmic chaperone [Pantoea sp. JZ29]|uniref:fimbria/pilus periplasmic chaperone n=1 Tax=Pantoea sp. JZ29 TaxID=2654192 RepID=UPI002B46FA47|nr:fimbria/pilus periplasmic chaperone [Pantoea sp. JZ29]